MEDHIGFLVTDVARLLRKQLDARVRHLGVTGPQVRLLLNVARNPGLNQGALADRLEVEPITTCRMIDRLEQAGLVQRERDPSDRRAWLLFLTDDAKALVDELRTIGDEMIDDAMAGFCETERASVCRLLGRLRVNLSEEFVPEPKARHHG